MTDHTIRICRKVPLAQYDMFEVEETVTVPDTLLSATYADVQARVEAVVEDRLTQAHDAGDPYDSDRQQMDTIPVEDVTPTPVHPRLARMSNTGPPARTEWTPYTKDGIQKFRAPRSLVGTDYLGVMDELLAGKRAEGYALAELDGQKWVLSASHAKGRYEATLWRKPA